MAVNWLDGEGKLSPEKFSPGRHITPNEWRTEFGTFFHQPHYDYISDYECVFHYPYSPGYYLAYNGVSWQPLQQVTQLRTNVHSIIPYNPYNGVRWPRLQQAKQLGTNI